MAFFDVYIDRLNKLSFPTSPPKPYLAHGELDPQKIHKYAIDIANYNDELKEYKEKRARYYEDKNKIEADLKTALLDNLGIKGTIFEQPIFSLAWEFGHSAGWQEVYNYASDITDKFREVIDKYNKKN